MNLGHKIAQNLENKKKVCVAETHWIHVEMFE